MKYLKFERILLNIKLRVFKVIKIADKDNKVDETDNKVEAKTDSKVEAKTDSKVEAKTDSKVEAKTDSKVSKKNSRDGVVFIGNKPPMNYVLAVVTQFHGGSGNVHIKARGRAISRAVDVAEIVRNRFIEGVTVSRISISTEVIKGENGEDINVSAIDIELAK